MENDKKLIDDIVNEIEKNGANKCWKHIEKNYSDALLRYKIRSMFFQACQKLKISTKEIFKK